MSGYKVEAYDNFDALEERCYSPVGSFSTVAEAITCAKAVINASLDRLRQQGLVAGQLFAEWVAHGEGVRLLGEPAAGFNPYDYAKTQAYGERPPAALGEP